MTITLNIIAQDAEEMATHLLGFAKKLGHTVEAAIETVAPKVEKAVETVVDEVIPPKTPRKNAKAAPTTIEGTATVVADTADVTLDQVREESRELCKSPGGLEAFSKALKEFGAKKISDIPESTGVTAPTYAKFLAAVKANMPAA